jgi:hypothetical protein
VSGADGKRVDFVAADNPHANKLMVHMLANARSPEDTMHVAAFRRGLGEGAFVE